MDSVNLSDTQSTPINCKSTASNTNPVSCVCCSSKEYVQAFPQAYYFTPIYQGMPKCKHPHESFEENFKFQQPFFSSPPFFHPFFHNIAIPPNFFWAQNRFDATTANKQHKQTNEREIIRTSNHSNSSPRGRNGFSGDKAELDEDAQKQNNTLGPEFLLSEQNFTNMSNITESHISTFVQPCACGDSIPWTCNPFIAPIISYCLFWNSQKPNMNAAATNFADDRPETSYQKNNENPVNQKLSNPNNNNNNNNDDNNINSEAFSNNLNIIENTNNNLTQTQNCSQESGLEIDQQIESNDQNSGKSSTFLSLKSLNYIEDNSFKHLEKEDPNRSVNTGAGEEGEDTEIEGFDSEDQEESDECLKSDKKDLSNKNSNLYLSLDSSYNLKESECRSPLESQSYIDIKTRKNSTNSMDILLSGEQVSDISAGGKICFHFLQDSDNETKKGIPLNEVSDLKEHTASKKFIKNFTMTDQTNSVSLQEEHIRVAFAGDLGGDNCIGYKVNISSSSFEEDQEEKILQETQTEESSESAKISQKDVNDLDERKSEIFSEKNTNENPKSGRSTKSSIAKLSSNSKSKDSKSDSAKTVKQNKESYQKETNTIKRKHNCFPLDHNATAVIDKSTKIQKPRNCTAVRQYSIGSEKQHKEANSTIQPFRNPSEKSSTAKVRSVNTAQKTARNTGKK